MKVLSRSSTADDYQNIIDNRFDVFDITYGMRKMRNMMLG